MGAPDISVQVLFRPVAEIDLPGLPTTDTGSPEYIFWKEQIGRCLNGWIEPLSGRYINGIHYFYINFVSTDYFHPGLKKLVKDAKPLWRDNDAEVTDCFWKDLPRMLPNGRYKSANSHIEIKARRKGWTYLDLLAGNLYTFVFFPEYPVGSAYIDDENLEEEREMFRKAWLSLHPIFKRWSGHEMSIIIDNKLKGQLSIGYNSKKDKTDIEHNSWYQKIVSPTNPGVFKGSTYHRINVVEAGKWKQKDLLKRFLSQNVDCLRFGADYVGGYSIGGTSDEIEGIDTDYKLIYFDRKSYPYSRHMTSAVKVHATFFDIHTGTTDEKAALDYELSQREMKKDDYVLYQTHVVENPLTEEEMFIPKAQYSYNTATLQSQLTTIFYNELHRLWIRGCLVPQLDLNGMAMGYNFEENGKGEWDVHSKYGLPDPRFKNLVIASIDDKYKNQNKKTVQSGSSKSAMIVKLRKHNFEYPSNRPIAVFQSPSFDLNDTFEEFYKGMLYWDIYKTLYEYNHEAFVGFLRNKGALSRLQYVDEQPGITVTGAGGISKEVTLLGNISMALGEYKNIDNPDIIKALMKWGGPENTDIGTCWHLLYKLEDILKGLEVELSSEEKKMLTKFIVLGQTPQSNNILLGPAGASGFIKLGVPNWYRQN